MIENNMSYEGFKEYFREQLKNTLGEGIEIQEENSLKNNDLQVEMLTCKEEGKNLTPRIRTREFYDLYRQQGMKTAVEVATGILGDRRAVGVHEVIEPWEVMKSGVNVEVINYEWNQERLKEEKIVYEKILDLAIVFTVNLREDEALEAVKQAVASPLLETTIAGASHVIINVSGDITLMDASDAAEYVQELAGEDANIIFGAMYDDSRADEATITVIATGLHNVGGSASKLKSRLENQGRTSAMPHGQQGHASAYERPVRQSSAMYGQQQAVRTPQAERPVSPRLDFGTTTQRETTGTATRRPMGGTTPTLDTPRTPTSKVKEQSIKIPDFFKK